MLKSQKVFPTLKGGRAGEAGEDGAGDAARDPGGRWPAGLVRLLCLLAGPGRAVRWGEDGQASTCVCRGFARETELRGEKSRQTLQSEASLNEL